MNQTQTPQSLSGSTVLFMSIAAAIGTATMTIYPLQPAIADVRRVWAATWEQWG